MHEQSEHAKAVEPYDAALRMLWDAINELFGLDAALPNEDAVLMPRPEQRAEAMIEGLQRVAAVRPRRRS